MLKPIPNNNQKSLKENDFIVSKTDTKGIILYGNRIFIELSGYAENELLGKPHSILRHADMPKIIFQLLWERIQNKKEIFAYVKNLCKDGSYYWVYANITASLDSSNNIRDFHSVRRKPTTKAMEVIPKLYQELLESEKNGGVEASKKLLEQTLEKKGVDYDTFVLSLQQ
jgi:PAS domain S-box-containing protein